MSLLRVRRRRGFAIADFLAGTIIFSGVLITLASMTRAKLQVLAEADAQTRALARAEEALDDVRARGLPQAPTGAADTQGFRLVRKTPVKIQGLADSTVILEARTLVAKAKGSEASADRGLMEVRVRLAWTGLSGEGELALSSVVPRGKP